MRILFLSKNLENYKAANYQKEFLNALSKKTSLFVYGPGYIYFDENKSLNHIINTYGPFDVILIGHAWLHDINSKVDPWPKSGLSKIKIKKFLFINKEYTNLSKKLMWIKENKIDCVFSHHQDCKKWQMKCRTKFKFLPFAFDDKYFFYSQKKRKYDLAFSGVLQNSIIENFTLFNIPLFKKKKYKHNKIQSDLRIRILKLLYFTIFNIPLIKRKKYRHLSIFWNSIPNNFWGQILSKIFKFYKFLNIKDYSQLQRNSKVYLNSKSPMNLISPRYFENIASGCIIITEKNNELKKFLPKSSYIEFSKDLSNFEEVLNESLIKFNSLKKIRKKNSDKIKKNYNWNITIKIVLQIIKILSKKNYKLKKVKN